MNLQLKLSTAVIVSIGIGIVLAVVMLFVIGNTFAKGYSFQDIDNLGHEIQKKIANYEGSIEDIQSQLGLIADRHDGVDIQLIDYNGSLLYSSTDRTTGISFEEMTDLLSGIPARSETYTTPYKTEFNGVPVYAVQHSKSMPHGRYNSICGSPTLRF